jgi:hypothetical protein
MRVAAIGPDADALAEMLLQTPSRAEAIAEPVA